MSSDEGGDAGEQGHSDLAAALLPFATSTGFIQYGDALKDSPVDTVQLTRDACRHSEVRRQQGSPKPSRRLQSPPCTDRRAGTPST
eukprot:2223913-Pyramimonas_sp.AAC.1